MKSFTKILINGKYKTDIRIDFYTFLYEYAKFFSLEFGFYEKEFTITFSLLFFSITLTLKNVFSNTIERDISFIIYKRYIYINLYSDLDKFDSITKRYYFYFVDYFFGKEKKIYEKHVEHYNFIIPTPNGKVITTIDVCLKFLKRKYWFKRTLYCYDVESLKYDGSKDRHSFPKHVKISYDKLLLKIMEHYISSSSRNGHIYNLNLNGIIYKICDIYNYNCINEEKARYLISIYDGRPQGTHETIYQFIDKIEFDRMCKLEEIKKLI